MIAYLNGKILPIHKLKISPYDLGLLRAYAVFDVMRTYNGKPFLIEEHWKRLCNSAKEVGLSMPIKEDEFRKIIKELLKKNKFTESNIRTVLTGGVSENGFFYTSGKETVLILVEKFNPLSPDIFKKGVKVVKVKYARDFPKSKTTNYLAAVKNQGKKNKSKAFEIVYIDDSRRVLETATSNFFIVKKRVVVTPKEGVLDGITRKVVLVLARKLGMGVEERDIKEEELRDAQEAFLTATNKDIVPIVQIDNNKIGDGKVGDITRVLMEEFRKSVQ